jgi:hypothetical protein
VDEILVKNRVNNITVDTKRGVKTTRSDEDWSFAIRLGWLDQDDADQHCFTTVRAMVSGPYMLAMLLDDLSDWAAAEALRTREDFNLPPRRDEVLGTAMPR